MPTEISQDFEVLRETALTLMTYGAQTVAAGKAAEIPPPEVEPVYANWVRHLMAVERASALRPMPLRTDVARGLQALAMARGEFTRQHKGCPGCGIWLPRWVKFCSCGWREK